MKTREKRKLLVDLGFAKVRVHGPATLYRHPNGAMAWVSESTRKQGRSNDEKDFRGRLRRAGFDV